MLNIPALFIEKSCQKRFLMRTRGWIATTFEMSKIMNYGYNIGLHALVDALFMNKKLCQLGCVLQVPVGVFRLLKHSFHTLTCYGSIRACS